MSFITKVRASRPLQIVILILFALVTYYQFFTKSNDSYTPEELNSLLQNKDESTVAIKKVELTNQGLHKPYLDSVSLKLKDWDIGGNTLIKNNDYVRLTGDNQHQVGNLFNKFPIQAESFEMELTFHIHSKTTNGLVGDGFAIWFLDEKSPIGDVFGSKNYFNGLGIMIDTYKNGKRGHFPFVNLMLGDGKTFYNKETDGFETRLAGCVAKSLLNPTSKISKARIVYIKDGYLSLDFNYNGIDEDWQNCVTLTNVLLPPVKYLGFSSENGDLTEAVDLLENKIFALYNPDEEGVFIESVDQLTNLIKEQAEADQQVAEDFKKGGGRHRSFKKKKTSGERRKSLKRLKNAEKRLKERERELRIAKYGDAETTFLSNLLNKIWKLIIWGFYIILTILVAWILFSIYRVQKQQRKSKTTGLLD